MVVLHNSYFLNIIYVSLSVRPGTIGGHSGVSRACPGLEAVYFIRVLYHGVANSLLFLSQFVIISLPQIVIVKSYIIGFQVRKLPTLARPHPKQCPSANPGLAPGSGLSAG